MTILTSTAEMLDLGGGQFQNTIHVKPIHFKRNGMWRKIENILGASGDQNFQVGADELMQFRVRSSLAGNAPVVHIGHGGEYVRITPLDTNNVNGTVVGSSIIYPEAWNNADLKITAIGHKVKKEVILRAGHPISFAFRVDEKAYTDKLILSKPILNKNGLSVALDWLTTSQGGKEVLTVILPAGDWDGWILDPTYTSQPDATAGIDTYMDSGAPTSNFDAGGINIGEFNVFSSRFTRALIKFDISSIPSNATSSSGTFTIRISADYSDNARTFTMYPCLRNWGETTCTHNKYDGTNNWTTAGCGSAGNDFTNTSNGTCSYGASDAVNTDKDYTMVTSEIDKFINGTYTNYGWLIQAATELNDAYAHYDSDDATSANRPKLVIVYTVPSSHKFLTLLGVG